MAKRMNRLKKGNVTLMLFPIGIMILIAILVAITFLYVQIIVQIYEVKSNLFYIISSSIGQEDMENLAYRDYSLDVNKVQEKVDNLLKENYLRKDVSKGIIDIQCQNIKLIKSKGEISEHTKNKYTTPVMCVDIKIVFSPIISLIGDKVNFSIHDDIKFSLLEFGE